MLLFTFLKITGFFFNEKKKGISYYDYRFHQIGMILELFSNMKPTLQEQRLVTSEANQSHAPPALRQTGDVLDKVGPPEGSVGPQKSPFSQDNFGCLCEGCVFSKRLLMASGDTCVVCGPLPYQLAPCVKPLESF